MKIGDKQKLTESGSGENDDSNIRYYCKTEELFDVMETAYSAHSTQYTKGQDVKTLSCLRFVKTFSLSLPFYIFVRFF